MEELLGTAADVRLGLDLPANFDQAVADGRSLELNVYAVHWAKQAEVDEQRLFFERALGEVTGQPVALTLHEQRVYPPPEGQGFSSLATSVIVLVTLTTGIALVPHLIGEERQARTIDALLISPASIGQIVAAKALAGSVYCLVVAVVAIAFNAKYFVHLEVVAATIGCATLFAVGVGLLLGSLFELPQSMNAVAGLVLAVLLVPVYLAGRLALPPALHAIVAYVPSAALDAVLATSLARTVPWTALWPKLGSVLACSAVVYAVTIWRIRRAGR
jgi:ABC-2 type transport system permease protein